MSELSDFIASECSGMTPQEALAHCRAQTVTEDGIAQSGYVMAYLAESGKYTVLEDMASDRSHANYDDLSAVPDLTKDYLYGVIKTAMNTLNSREGFDFRLAGVISTMGLLVSLGILSADDQAAIRALAQKSVPRFPGLTLRQIITIDNPELASPSQSNIVTLTNKRSRSQLLVVTLTNDLPEPINIQFRVRNKFGEQWSEWEGSSIVGLTAKQYAGVYSARLPGEFVRSDTTEIMVQCSYNVSLTLAVEAV